MNLVNRLRVCPYCGGFLGVVRGLCEACVRKVQLNPSVQYIQGMRVRTLINWQNEELISELVHNLKGGLQSEAWDYWANKFINEHILKLRQYPRFIVASPSRNHKPDHAHHFARAIENETNAELCTPLYRVSHLAQKNQNKNERQNLKFARRTKQDFGGDAVIFADDIVTTGATARAAHEALGGPKNFEVWALVFREKYSD